MPFRLPSPRAALARMSQRRLAKDVEKHPVTIEQLQNALNRAGMRTQRVTHPRQLQALMPKAEGIKVRSILATADARRAKRSGSLVAYLLVGSAQARVLASALRRGSKRAGTPYDVVATVRNAVICYRATGHAGEPADENRSSEIEDAVKRLKG
jgi:hypothetical protein